MNAKAAIVVGTRPEIIKMSSLIRRCVEEGLAFTLVHTGQHYTYTMDALFFEELDLPAPQYNIQAPTSCAERQGEQTAFMLSRLEALWIELRPRIVLVQGDTNSVLAGALSAAKLRIPVGHVEAGLRSFDRRMPEEINRVLCDHLSQLLFAPTPTAVEHLEREGVTTSAICCTGNTIVDALMRQRERAEASPVLTKLGVARDAYALVTLHRPENVDQPDRLRTIIAGLERAARRTGLLMLCPLHPRTHQRLADHDIALPPAIRAIEPVGYHACLRLEAAARLIVTDSGGLQEEACILGVPCVTLRDNTERPETLAIGCNILVGADPERITEGCERMLGIPRDWQQPFGDGRAAEAILDSLERHGLVERTSKAAT